MTYLESSGFVYNAFGGIAMELSLSILCGVIVTVMTIFNGQLSDYFGVFLSTVLIHLTGFLTLCIIMKIKRKQIRFCNHLPILYYTGGMIGVLTVLFNVMTVNALGVALLTALGLLGQMITSLILEQNGWLGSLQRKMNPLKLMSLGIVVLGIGVMIL